MSRSMNFDVTATDNASREFLTMAQAAERLETKLKALDRLRVEPTADLNITPANRKIDQLQSRLNALRNVRAKVEVEGAAEARRDVTALVVEMRKLRNVRVRLDVDGNGRADVAALATQLRTLARDVKVKVSLDDGTFARDIARLHQRVSALRGTTVRINFDLQPPGIRAELEGIAAALGRIRNTRARVDVDTNGATAAVARLGSALGKIGKGGAIALSIPGIVNLIGQVGSLGSSVVALTGVLGLVPAAGLAAGAALGTVAIGLQGLGDALGPTGTAAELEKVNAAMAKLSPAGRELVTQIRALAPAWDALRLDVQERLLAGVGDEVQQLAAAHLPNVRAGLGGVATELNSGVRMWSDWAGSGPAVADLNTILGNTRTTLRELAPAGTNVAAALTDISVVGSEIMPELAAGATQATARFREFIAEARRTGELEQWIRGGIATMEQLGRITLNTGGILGSVFSASEEAGYGFLDAVEQITGELDALLSSTAGRTALVEVFRESRDAINAALPGIRELAGAALEMLANFARSDGLQRFAELVSQTASAISPLVTSIGTLAGDALGGLAGGASLAVSALSPLVGGVAGILDALGPLPGLVLASVAAFKGMALLAAPLATLGATIAGLSIATGWGAASAAVAGFGAALTGLAKALPLIAVGAILVGQAVQAASGDMDAWAAGMIAGGEAARKARADFEAHNAQFAEGSIAAALFAKSEAELTAEINNQISALGPLEQAQARAQLAQTAYNDAVVAFGPLSAEARSAAAGLADATNRVEIEQLAARNATDLHTAAMIQQSDVALAATNAGLGYERALITLEQAQIRAAEAARDHGVGSLQARDAALAVTEASFRAAAAAGEKARADGVASKAANVDELAARAQKDELLRLADANSGPVRQSLLDAAAAIDIQASAASRAETAARLHKDELGRLAGQSSGVLAEAIRGTIANFDRLGGAHATAQERARLQEAALRNLANMASGPVRDELNRMADQLRAIPDAEFDVTATGRGKFAGIPSGVSTPGRLATGGVWGGPGDVRRAATGTVLPGYTPGRDVHDFTSPTGGRLLLSGGEAVMRPEWTRAVGPRFIDQANRAARTGGVPGVADFLARASQPNAGRDLHEFARGGVIGPRPPVQRFAFGGLVRRGTQPFSEVVNRQYIEARDRMADHLTPLMQARIREMEAAAARAAAAALGGGNGAGWQWQMNVLRQRFPGLPLISGFRPGAITATGNPSYHGKGRAVDIPPRMDVFNWIRGNYGATAREIIFSPAGGLQIHNGRPHVYTGVTKSMHYDHVHWAQKQGGILPGNLARQTKLADRGGLIPSGMGALNLSGRAERMLSPRQTEVFERLVTAISRPRGSGAGNSMAQQMRVAVMQPRPTSIATGGVNILPLLREIAGLRADLGARPPMSITQNFDGAGPTAQTRDAAFGIRVALG